MTPKERNEATYKQVISEIELDLHGSYDIVDEKQMKPYLGRAQPPRLVSVCAQRPIPCQGMRTSARGKFWDTIVNRTQDVIDYATKFRTQPWDKRPGDKHWHDTHNIVKHIGRKLIGAPLSVRISDSELVDKWTFIALAQLHVVVEQAHLQVTDCFSEVAAALAELKQHADDLNQIHARERYKRFLGLARRILGHGHGRHSPSQQGHG